MKKAIEGADVQIERMPFELRPYPQPTLKPEGEYLRRAWIQAVFPLATRMGVEIRMPSISPQPHTHYAFEGLQFAKDEGKAEEYNLAVLKGFFQANQNIGDVDILTRIAGDVGLDRHRFQDALLSRRYREIHQQALRHAYDEMGITAVPTFVIGSTRLEGMQSEEALSAAIRVADA